MGQKYKLCFTNKYFNSEVALFQDVVHIPIYRLYDTKEQRQALANWYFKQAKIEFNLSLNRMYPLVKKFDVYFPKIEIRKMKSRWGSCFIHQNKIILNIFLIYVSRNSIDYVMLHELTHFLYPNHGIEFKHFIQKNLPDWKERDYELHHSFCAQEFNLFE